VRIIFCSKYTAISGLEDTLEQLSPCKQKGGRNLLPKLPAKGIADFPDQHPLNADVHMMSGFIAATAG